MKGLRSPFPLVLAVLGCLGGRSGLVNGHGFTRRAVDNPGPDSFIRHRYPTVVAFDNYVYIDGGEAFQQSNGTATNGTQPGQAYTPYAVSSTLSLRLNESWTNETVRLRTIPKVAPLLSQQIHWTDASIGAGVFYTWGGMVVGDEPAPNNQLWLFNADGTGGGRWSQVPQLDFSDFSKLVRPAGAAFTQGAGVGYALGGQATSKTDRSIQKSDPGYALPGLISYNFQTGDWKNDTSGAYGGYGTSLYGSAEYIPFGPNGLLIYLGGAESPVDATDTNIVDVSWNELSLHDPVTGKWYKQKTTGARPPTVKRACTVGVRGPNNTYEIYIYGGTSSQTAETSSDVHVLSLPGFVFFNSSSSGTPRADHACAVVGKGKRQMLSYGGVDFGPGLRDPSVTPDPWKQGLGIYDMSAMAWKDSYDADAADYESPDVVKDWYAHGNMGTVAWNTDAVKGLFVNGSSSAYGELNSTTSSGDESSGSSQKIGAIVGGSVGGVVVFSLAGTIILLLLRRRRNRRQEDSPANTIEEYRPEPWPKDSPRLRSTTPGTMMTFVSAPTPVPPVEISGTTRGELPAEDVEWTYELPVPTPYQTPRLRPQRPDRPELPDQKFSI